MTKTKRVMITWPFYIQAYNGTRKSERVKLAYAVSSEPLLREGHIINDFCFVENVSLLTSEHRGSRQDMHFAFGGPIPDVVQCSLSGMEV